MQPEKQGEQNYWQPQESTVVGQVPSSAPPSAPTPSSTPVQPQPSAAPTPPPAPQPPTQPVAEPQPPVAESEPGPVPDPFLTQTPPPPPPPSIAPISWSASEFIQHEKSPIWFFGLILVGVVLIAASILLLRDWFSAFIVIVLLVGIAIVAARKPRTMRYVLDSEGIHIGEALHPYEKFHAFSLVSEDGLWSIILMPNARFSPTLTLYFDKDQGEDIVDALNDYLPMQEHKVDLVDRISRKIRF